jgi:hypothetical protein
MDQLADQTEPTSDVSPEEYLRLEREAEFKHEYFQGKFVPWPGPATRAI